MIPVLIPNSFFNHKSIEALKWDSFPKKRVASILNQAKDSKFSNKQSRLQLYKISIYKIEENKPEQEVHSCAVQ